MTGQRARLRDLRRSASRRPGIFPGRRFALALVIAGVSVACSAGAAAANPNLIVQASIHQRNGAVVPASVTISSLQGNPGQCAPYTGTHQLDLHDAGGGTHTDDFGNDAAWSLAAVVGCLSTPVPSSAVNGITVVQSNGSPEFSQYSQLGPSDLTTPSPFADPTQVPVIYTDGTNITYDRPWRGQPDDDNAIDQVRESTPFQIEVYEGAIIPVTVTASEMTVAAGGTVTFGATVPAANSPGISYTWNFGGGAQGSQTASGANTSATFATPGEYEVGVLAANAAGGGGGAQVLITVTGPTQTSTTPPGTNTTGPTGGNGTTPGAPAAPATGHQPGPSGNGQGSTSPTPGAGKHKPSGHGSTPGSGGTSNVSGHAGSGSGSPSGSTSSDHGKPAQNPSSAAGGAATTKRRPPSATGPSTLVTGRLISNVTPLPAGSSPLVHAESGVTGTSPPLRRPTSASILPALAGALVVFALFTLGAGRELRWQRGRRLLPFGG